ncbi:MAG: hypothetical protein WBD31_05725 [Rubripirellula sp.]
MCAIADTHYAAAMADSSMARIGDQAVSRADVEAIQDQLIAKAGKTTVATASASLSQSRWLAGLLRDGIIELTIDQTQSMAAMRSTIARDGNISATLGDVKKHADVVWAIGSPETAMPRIWERLECKPVSDTMLGASELADRFFAIRNGAAVIGSVAQAIASAKYLAVVIGPGGFLPGEEIATAELLVKWVIDRNREMKSGSQRVVLLAIDPAATLRSVVGWQTNERIKPTLGPVDLRIGDASEATYPAKLQVGGIDPGAEMAESFLAATVPGIDFDDAVIRGDGTVTLPLEAIGKQPR